MSIRKHQPLMKCPYFYNIEDTNEKGRYYKMQNVLNIICKKCLSVSQGKEFTINQMIISYKGKKVKSKKQYTQNK